MDDDDLELDSCLDTLNTLQETHVQPVVESLAREEYQPPVVESQPEYHPEVPEQTFEAAPTEQLTEALYQQPVDPWLDQESVNWIRETVTSDPQLEPLQLEILAKGLGVTVEQLPMLQHEMAQVLQQRDVFNTTLAHMDFIEQNPTFTDTPENVAAIQRYLPQDVLEGQRRVTAQDLRLSWAQAVLDGVGERAPTPGPPPPQRYMPPIPSSQGYSPIADPAPEAMSIKQLRAALIESHGQDPNQFDYTPPRYSRR